VLLGESASIEAGAAAGDVATVPGESLEQPVQGVIAVGGLLAGDGAGDGVSHQEDRGVDVAALGQGYGEANGVESLIRAVGRPVEDEQGLLHASSVVIRGSHGRSARPCR
jgi:hypothetical protein